MRQKRRQFVATATNWEILQYVATATKTATNWENPQCVVATTTRYIYYVYIHAVAVALLASPAHHVATQRWVGFKGPNPHRVDDMTSDPTNLSLFRQNQKLRMSQ